jgi:two-component system chemotaxis response regulator CheB
MRAEDLGRRSRGRPDPDEKAAAQLDVLIIDDSAVVRQVLLKLLKGMDGFRVDAASDPIFALEKMEARRPDVILLDLTLPRMDGFTFLEDLMARDPIPVVVISGTAPEGSARAMRALDLGAVELIAKPAIDISGFLHRTAEDLRDTIRSAAAVRVKRRGLLGGVAQPARFAPGYPWVESQRPIAPRRTEEVIAIGASTGGPEGLRIVLEGLSRFDPGVVIAQHMPVGFTAAFAKRLDQESRISVREAEDCEQIMNGQALLAPGDRHIRVVGTPGNFRIQLKDRGSSTRNCPNVDQLFRSVASVAGAYAVGILLSGMGNDGAAGLAAMKKAGARTLAESEESCAVFGMPRKAIELGIVDQVLSKAEIAEVLADIKHSR